MFPGKKTKTASTARCDSAAHAARFIGTLGRTIYPDEIAQTNFFEPPGHLWLRQQLRQICGGQGCNARFKPGEHGVLEILLCDYCNSVAATTHVSANTGNEVFFCFGAPNGARATNNYNRLILAHTGGRLANFLYGCGNTAAQRE